MNNAEDTKKLVRDKYAEIASQSLKVNQESCCGCGGTETIDYSTMADDYADIEGCVPDADLGLGCGLPTEYAKMSKGDTVLDLGSGAGNDVFIARQMVGETGYVIGIDFTQEMVNKAIANREKLGFSNIEFRLGEIEDLPIENDSVDVVLSNCVLNLVPDKEKAFSQIYRVLKPEGHFCVSDIVLNAELPDKLRGAAEMYAGCVAGALRKEDYLNIVADNGFRNIEIVKEKPIVVPDNILEKYLTKQGIEDFRKNENPISSITVYADK